MNKAPNGYTQHEEEIEVPRGTGIEGFMATLRQVLKLPRIQDVHIDARGKISYSFFLREGEEKKTILMDFDALMPYAVVRNSQLEEIAFADVNAAVALLQMFRRAGIDHVFPTAFVVGSATQFWPWYKAATGVEADVKEELLGLPVLPDRSCPDDVLLLCTAYSRSSGLAETQKVYKIAIPQVKS